MSNPPARRRVAVACTPCRVKKIRCSGRQPECERCHEAGIRCEYNYQSDRRKPPSKKYVEALHSRIGILERRLQQLQPPEDAQGDATATQPISYFSNENDFDIPAPLPLSNENDLVDDLTQLYGRLDVAEDGHLRYFGAQSYFNLLRRPQYESVRKYESKNPDDYGEQDEYHEISSGLPNDIQDHLLGLFWTWQNPWQYLVHRKTFCEALSNGAYNKYCTPLLLQCVLALASRYSDQPELRDSPDQPETAGNALVNQAKAILHFEMEIPTTSTVAALALLALREMSVNKEALGWTYVGMAIRIAYNLGLNYDCTEWVTQGKITEEEAEIRKITWWGCFLLDKLFAVALGRPGMVQQRDITVAKPSLLPEVELNDWEFNGQVQTVSIPTSRSVSNMHYMCDIFQIAAEPLEEMYAPNSRLTLEGKEEKANKGYADLSRLYNNLPSFLKLPGSFKVARTAHIYSLHLQYYVIVILLHRPFLRRQNHKDPQHNVMTETALHHNGVCTDAAEKISAIMKTYRSHFTLRTIPISTVHAVGTASIIHLLRVTSTDPDVSRKASRLLKFNLLCLQEMAHAWSWSLRAIRSIQMLAEDWAVSETINSNAKQKSRSKETAEVTTEGSIKQPVESAGLFEQPHGPPGEDIEDQDWFNVGDFENLNWLMEYDSSMTDEAVDAMMFDQHLWPVGL